MDKQIYDDNAIAQYLLGALPESDTERLDELCVTDDEFADALEIAEKDLVDAYVQGELTGADLERFKSHYLTSPLRREKVEFAHAFQVFAEKNAAAQAVKMPDQAREKPKASGGFSLLSFFTAPRLAWQWGFAAVALVLLIAGGLLVFQNLRLRQQMTQTQARRDELLQREQNLQKEIQAQRSASSQTEQELARVRDERERLEQELKKRAAQSPDEGNVVSLILTPPMRGAGQLPTVSIKTGTSVVAMQLQLEAADYSAYRVALIDPANNQTLWRSGNLKPRAKGERKAIGVSFSATLLKPQNYILRVSGLTAGGSTEIISDYPFKVVK
jgi:hypothetical protein